MHITFGHGHRSPDTHTVVLFSKEAFAALSSSCPSKPLLPNLRCLLRFGVTPTKFVPAHDLFVSPTITTLLLEWLGKLTDDIQTLMDYVCEHCPRLANLQVTILNETWPVPTPPQARPRIFSRLMQLDTVILATERPLPPPMVMDLQPLPRLMKLSLTFYDDSPWKLTACPPTMELAFPVLKELTLIVPRAVHCISMLAAFCFPMLEELDLGASMIGQTGPLFQTIHDRCDLNRLKMFKLRRLEICGYGDDDYYEPPITPDSLRPLYAFPAMRKAELDVINEIQLADADLRELALAWPQLEDLRLLPDESHQPSYVLPVATMAGLVHFARHCPQLRYLYIAVNTSQTSVARIFDALPNAVQPDCAVEHVVLGECFPVGDPQQIAGALAVIFRRLQKFSGGYPYVDEKDLDANNATQEGSGSIESNDENEWDLSVKQWSEVARCLPFFRRRSAAALKRWWETRHTL